MRGAWVLLFLALGRPAIAQQDDETAALLLADQTHTEPTAQRACLEYGELAAINTTYSNDMPSGSGGRASFSFRCDVAFASQWRAVLSNRFDYFWGQEMPAQALNTLKEAYVSFRDGGAQLFDVGRINVRQGVGFAYNPSDYFRANAVRSVISIDPDTLRDEQLGTLMARSQTLWSSGSVTAMFAPRVSGQPNDSAINPDVGATNGERRWMLILSQRLGGDFQPQLSVAGAEHQAPQAGLNLTYLLNQATVAYVEWAGGRSASNLARSGYYGPAVSGASAFRSRLSTGFTYTTPFKLSVTLEYEYDGPAPGRDEWNAVRNGPLAPYVQYRQYAAAQGELAARENFFAYAHWEDVGIPHLDLTAFVRFDPYDRSRVIWSEARYHWAHAGVAVQWQRHSGDATSDLAPWPQRQVWVALIDYYF
jgi:hypothetical protein